MTKIVVCSLAIAAIAMILSAQIMQQAFFVGTVLPAIPTIDAQGVWYSGDCITYTASICGTPANASTIVAWADRSGNAHDLSTGTGTATFNTGQINGYPAVTFSGNVQFVTGTNFGTNSGGHFNAFVVLQRANSSTKYTLISGTSNTWKYWTATTMQGIDAANVTGGPTGTAAGDTNWHQMNVQWLNNGSGGTTTTFRLDRASDGTPANSINTNAGEFKIGFFSSGSENFAGQLAELIFYNASLTGPQVTQVETYLNVKYGL